MTTIPVMARVVLISDLLGDNDDLIRVAAQRTVAGGIVECVHVVAAEELALPPGAHLARDPDAPSWQRAMHRRAHAEYHTRFAAFRAEAARRWRASGAGYVEARTDQSVSRLVRQIVSGLGRSASGAVRT